MQRMFVSLVLILFSLEITQAQPRKLTDGMTPTQKREFIRNGGLRGKCSYERCYNRCMQQRGMDQFSNAKCAERCSRIMGCV
jgi:hypothetical protein